MSPYTMSRESVGRHAATGRNRAPSVHAFAELQGLEVPCVRLLAFARRVGGVPLLQERGNALLGVRAHDRARHDLTGL